MEILFFVLVVPFYIFIGIRYTLKSIPILPRLMRDGRSHPEAAFARVKGTPDWAVSIALLLAVIGAAITIVIMAAVWPLVVILDRLIDWK